ncbi:hypothetical protein IH779_02265 [Patescibacteria group bacterium]|nr:hypothetical protein [Patescibacteria group bacterium]
MESIASRTSSQELSREIMGNNFLGVEEVVEHFGISLVQEELAKIAEVPFFEATLQECKDSHVLFLGVPVNRVGNPLTVNYFRDMFPADSPRFWAYQDSRYDRERFATEETCELRWYLLRKSILDESRPLDYKEQNYLLQENEYRERAIVYIFCELLMFRARSELLFKDDWVWCTDVDSDGSQVRVGRPLVSEGLYVSLGFGGHYVHHPLGLIPARKEVRSNFKD